MTTPSGTDILRTLRDAQRSGGGSVEQKAVALERLLLISQEISTLDLPTVLRLILHHVLDWTGTRQGAILLADGVGGLRVELAVGLEQEELVDIELRISRSVALRALEGQVVVIEDAPASPDRDQTSILGLGLQALLALPLRARDRIIGVIYLDTNSSSHRVHQLDVSILAAFAAQAAIALENARLHQKLKEDHLLLQRSVKETFRIDNILYRSPAMHRVSQAIRQVATSDVTVLVSGETGTGKELVARAIHYNSGRRNRRFLSQNAGALPDTLLESELFGHRRGAFSGALDHKTGLFEAADGGTVFLDEIGEASPAFQVRLLRILETGTFRRLGETTDRQVNVRIVAATHQNLEQEVQAGRFRADLFYRLSIFPIHLPPLRERREDIELLIYHFIDRFNGALGRSVQSVPDAVMKELLARSWPGNVRELQNVIQRLMVLSSGRELAAHPDSSEQMSPPLLLATTSDPGPAGSGVPLLTLEDVERNHIRHVLQHCGGNQAQAARLLALNRNTLRWRMKKLGI
jgi:transcriptional regulator with GAF, ATPase, and Fis domain